MFANFIVFGSILGFYEFNFFSSTVFIAGRITAFISFFLGGAGRGWEVFWLFLLMDE